MGFLDPWTLGWSSRALSAVTWVNSRGEHEVAQLRGTEDTQAGRRSRDKGAEDRPRLQGRGQEVADRDMCKCFCPPVVGTSAQDFGSHPPARSVPGSLCLVSYIYDALIIKCPRTRSALTTEGP